MVERPEGMNDGSPLGVVLLESARSAEPPHSSGSRGAIAASTSPEALRVATPLSSASKLGRASVHPSGSRRSAMRSCRAARSGLACGPRVVGLLPLGVGQGATVAQLAGARQHLVVDLEGLAGVEAQQLLGGRDLVLAERRAVGLAGVLRVGGGPGDDRAQPDQAGTAGLGLGGLDRLPQRGDVLGVAVTPVGPVDVLDVPAVGGVAGGHVLAEGDVGVVLDRDLVVVVDQDQVAQLLVAGQGRRLGADTLLDVTVAGQHEDVVVEGALTLGGVGVEQAALAARRHRHADRVADALPERAGGGLDRRGVVHLRVAGGLAAEGPQRLQVVQLQAEPAEVQLDVQRQAGVAAGEDETVPRHPAQVARVVAHRLLEQQVRRGGQAHRRARVAVADLLHRVHRQRTHGVDRPAVEVRPVQGAAHAGSSRVGGLEPIRAR